MEVPTAVDASTHRRPNRTAANRRAQYARAEARVTTHLLRSMDALSEHRGEQPSRLAGALAAALRPHAAPPAHEVDGGEGGLRNVRTKTSQAIEDRTRDWVETPGLPSSAQVEQMMLEHHPQRQGEVAAAAATASASSTAASEAPAAGPAALPSEEPNQ